MILDGLLETLSSNLLRKASKKCSDWAQNYVVYGKPVPGEMSFRRFPWAKVWHDLETSWAGMKAAQMGMTAAALNRAIYTIDIKSVDVLYLLPKRTPDATDFSKAKFDALLELSPHLRGLFSNVRNIGHKQAGSCNLYIRGARSRSGAKGISTGLIVFDEYDEMLQAIIRLAEERGSGYEEEDRQEIRISTPTAPDLGIDLVYKDGTQEHFTFKCLKCSRWTELIYPDCLKIIGDSVRDPRLKESYLMCKECKGEIPHELKPDYFERNEWVSTENHDAPLRTFQIPQMYSTVLRPWRIAKSAIKSKTDAVEEQEFFNSKLGLPHLTEGASIDDIQINKCLRPYVIPLNAPPQGIITMGVDVGKVLHVEIDQWLLPMEIGKDLNTYSVPKILYLGTIKDFEELDGLMHDYHISHCVVDHEPEFRKANEFALRFDGSVHTAYPHRGLSERQITIKAESNSVGFRRTSWLDLSQGRFRRQSIHLPRNISVEFREAIKSLVRLEKRNDSGDIVARYISRGSDHEAFARMFNELALVFAVSGRENKNVDVYL